jgi:Protein of unknown function with HXXEE motif
MPLPSFRALYLAYPIVLGVHHWDEWLEAKRLRASSHPWSLSTYFGSDVARFAMVLLVFASAAVALLNYIVSSARLVTLAELSVFALLFNAIGHLLMSMTARTRTPGVRSAALLVLPYTTVAIVVAAQGSGRQSLELWRVALAALVALPTAIAIALAIAMVARRLIARR